MESNNSFEKDFFKLKFGNNLEKQLKILEKDKIFDENLIAENLMKI